MTGIGRCLITFRLHRAPVLKPVENMLCKKFVIDDRGKDSIQHETQGIDRDKQRSSKRHDTPVKRTTTKRLETARS